MSEQTGVAVRWKTFLKAEHGAITVDWIALTATLVFMGIAAAFYLSSSVPVVANKTSEYMRNYDVGG